MAPRMIEALAIRPTGNVQGGFYFYNLASGCIISRRCWTSLPMPSKVINLVHKLAKKAKASKGIDYNDGTLELINEEQTVEQADMSGNIESNEVGSTGVNDDPNTTIVDAETSGVDAEIAGVDATGEDADYVLEN